MSLRRCVVVVRRRWRIVVGCVLLLELAVIGVALLSAPVYSSHVQMYVASPQRGQAYDSSLSSPHRVASYARLARTERLSGQVVRRLGLSLTPAELADRVTAEVPRGTVILDLSVTDDDPVQAQRITAALGTALRSTVARLETPASGGTATVRLAVVDPASLPTQPVSPHTWRNAGLALAAGLVLGLGLALLRELSDSSLRDATDVTEATRVPLLAQLFDEPVLGGRALLGPLSRLGTAGEAFRSLRTNLLAAGVEPDGHVVTVTSPGRTEGKTTTAAGLASALAEAGHRVLVVDADLRRGGSSVDLGFEQLAGLAEVLTEDVPLTDAVRTTSLPNLTVLPSGAPPPNPSELLHSSAMGRMLQQARKTYTMVIFDSPPLLTVTDASLLAARSDCALVVLQHRRTTGDELHGALTQLATVDAKVGGVVLNRVPRRRGGVPVPARRSRSGASERRSRSES